MMPPAELRQILLGLVGTVRHPDLAALTEQDWAMLDAMAAQHRLQPLLHYQHRVNLGIPENIRNSWAQAFRFQALQALRQQADLAATARLLQQQGLQPLALKGAWLSRFAYPQPAMRPLRDIDLLLDAETVLSGYQTLLDAGYSRATDAELPLEDAIRLEKHLPPLFAPGGTCIELHHRLWEPDGRMDHATPAQIDAAVRAQAITEADGLAYPAPIDMLAHLIAHAIYSHRLDCGPLLLADIEFLLKSRPVDWATFWRRSRQEGWRDGARLVLELVVTHRREVSIDFSGDDGPAVPPDILAAAPQLLLQDLTMRKSAGVLATVHKQGGKGLVNRLLGRRTTTTAPAVQRDMSAEGGFLGWATGRLKRTASDLLQRDVRQQAHNLAGLSRWLDRIR